MQVTFLLGDKPLCELNLDPAELPRIGERVSLFAPDGAHLGVWHVEDVERTCYLAAWRGHWQARIALYNPGEYRQVEERGGT